MGAAAATTREGFPRRRRLRKRSQFLAVRADGRSISGRSYLVSVRARPDERPTAGGAPGGSSVAAGPRFGITVTRKVGNAVARNRIKRLVREACRRMGDLFPAGLDVVVIARPGAASATAADTLAELTSLARRLGRGRGE